MPSRPIGRPRDKLLSQKLLHSRLGARWSNVDMTKSLKAGTWVGNVCKEQGSYCTMGMILGQVHT